MLKKNLKMNYKIQKLINKATLGLTEMGPDFGIGDILYNIKYGVQNLYKFFWVIWRWRGWDFVYNLELLARGLEVYLEKPNYEIENDRLPKENKIREVISLIENRKESDYITMAEEALEMRVSDVNFKFAEVMLDDRDGTYFEMIDSRNQEQKDNDKVIYDMAETIEQKEWDKLFEIMNKNGQGWWN